MRRFVGFVATIVVAVATAAGWSASAGAVPALSSGIALQQQTEPSLDEVAESLRSDAVYVDPEAERAISSSEADEVRDAISREEAAVFIAVLPGSLASTGEEANRLVLDLAQRTGLSGTYGVVVGDRFRAISSARSDADELATAAFQASADDGVAAVLTDFVGRVGAEAAAAGDGGGGEGSGDGSDGDGGSSVLPWVLLAGAGGGVYVWSRRRRARQRADDERRLAADREMLRAELSVLADDVMRLEPEVAIHPEARGDYDAAVERFRVAQAALDYADEPVDLVRVQRVVDEASYAMARARAITAGHEPPPPPDTLMRPGRHNEPPLAVDEVGQPYYVGGGPFYGGGWFGGGGGGLFSGLLLGSMLGGGWGFGGQNVEVHNYGDDPQQGDGWGGGFGGGDWGGGGDFGGGDFGGDIGGGDW